MDQLGDYQLVPGASLAREASEQRAGQYKAYGQALLATHPAASGANLGGGRLRRPGAEVARDELEGVEASWTQN